MVVLPSELSHAAMGRNAGAGLSIAPLRRLKKSLKVPSASSPELLQPYVLSASCGLPAN